MLSMEKLWILQQSAKVPGKRIADPRQKSAEEEWEDHPANW